MKARALWMVGLLAMSTAHAQQNNNQYFDEQQRIQQQQHAAEQARQGYMQSQEQPMQPPAGHWETMWGAIAADGPRGILGAVTDMGDKRAAESAALSQCVRNGGQNCKVEMSYNNQCAVLVTGDKKYLVQSAASIPEATDFGIKKCSQDDVNCRVFYSGCSQPKFVNN